MRLRKHFHIYIRLILIIQFPLMDLHYGKKVYLNR